MIRDGLAFGGRSGNRLHAVDIGEVGELRESDLVPVVNRRSLGICAGTRNRAYVTGVDGDGRVPAAVIGVHNAGHDVGRTRCAAPVRGVVAADAEIGAANDLEVVGKARMADGKIVGGEIDPLACDETVEVRLIGIFVDLLVAVVLHHDHEDMIKMPDTLGTWFS